jgi:hypothetical protein
MTSVSAEDSEDLEQSLLQISSTDSGDETAPSEKVENEPADLRITYGVNIVATIQLTRKVLLHLWSQENVFSEFESKIGAARFLFLLPSAACTVYMKSNTEIAALKQSLLNRLHPSAKPPNADETRKPGEFDDTKQIIFAIGVTSSLFPYDTIYETNEFLEHLHIKASAGGKSTFTIGLRLLDILTRSVFDFENTYIGYQYCKRHLCSQTKVWGSIAIVSGVAASVAQSLTVYFACMDGVDEMAKDINHIAIASVYISGITSALVLPLNMPINIEAMLKTTFTYRRDALTRYWETKPGRTLVHLFFAYGLYLPYVASSEWHDIKDAFVRLKYLQESRDFLVFFLTSVITYAKWVIVVGYIEDRFLAD